MNNDGQKKILVAFDGSPSSRNALRQAITLGERRRRPVEVLAVVPDYEGDLELVGVSNLKETLRGPTDRLAAQAREVADSLSAEVDIRVEHGEAYEKIIDAAKTDDCDLIVMGRRGLRRMERMLMGSVTARVISHSGTNVLVIPRDADIGWENICVATDGSQYSEAALELAIEYARELDGRITIVAAVDSHPEYYGGATDFVDKMGEKATANLRDAAGKVKAAGVSVQTLLLRGEPAQELTDMAKREGCGIIFAGSRGRSGIKKLLMGSVTEKIIGMACCPVFVAKSRD
ncbi:MAG TPA: universal stress protein [Actinobacteria bacterium]|nr:universal stress protein [Actinomycetota bacterium]